MAFLVVLLFLLFTAQGYSQSNDINSTNTFIGRFCGTNAVINQTNFNNNRISTLNDLRDQLLSKGVVYARAQALNAGDTVNAAAQCRKYLSVDQCVDCFDAGVSNILNCNSGNGASVCYDNCFIRLFTSGQPCVRNPLDPKQPFLKDRLTGNEQLLWLPKKGVGRLNP